MELILSKYYHAYQFKPGDGSACFELPCFPLAGYDVPPKGVPVSGSPALG